MADVYDYYGDRYFVATNFKRDNENADGDLNTKRDRWTYVSAWWDYLGSGIIQWQFGFYFREMHKDYTALRWDSEQYLFQVDDRLEWFVDSEPRPPLYDLKEWKNAYGFGTYMKGELHNGFGLHATDNGFKDAWMTIDGSGSDQKNALVVGIAYPHFKIRLRDRSSHYRKELDVKKHDLSMKTKEHFDELLAKRKKQRG